ncbi:MAG: hypothetical protein ACKOX6_16605 [Bdellovibrio sp.]
MKPLLLLLPLVFFAGCVHKRPMLGGVPMNYKLKSVPLTPYHWKIEYDGGGKVAFNPDGSGDLVFGPQIAKTSAQTFSTLLLLKDSLLKPIKNYVVKADITTVRQFRSSTPNEWEVFWFIGNYSKPVGSAKTANYFILKPHTGAELGRIYEDVGQHFLQTLDGNELQIGSRHTFYYIKENNRFRVFRDGDLIIDYQGKSMPEALYDHAGAIGLYTEDALVRIHSFQYQDLQEVL